MTVITEMKNTPVKESGIPLEKFMQELNELAIKYNKCLDLYAKVQEESASSEIAMYKIALSNVKRPSTHVPTEDEKAEDMIVVMDFVESRQELIGAQKSAFKALQDLQSKQTVFVNHVNKMYMDQDKELSELRAYKEATLSAPTPSRPSK